MKYIKTFEEDRSIDFAKFKVGDYVVSETDDSICLEQIKNIDELSDSIYVKNLLLYDKNKNITRPENSYTDYNLSYLKLINYTSNVFKKSYDFFIKYIELYLISNKYNL